MYYQNKTVIYLCGLILCQGLSSFELYSMRSALSQAAIRKYGSSQSPLFPLLSCKESRLASHDERQVAFNRRVLSAQRQTLVRNTTGIELQGNNDEFIVPHFAGQFTKLLEHDSSSGLLTPSGMASYQQLLQALKSGHQVDFNAIVRTLNAKRKLVNPQNAFTFSLEGSDSSLFTMQQPPHLTSAWAAADMIELYWKALCRDVHFSDYGTGLNTDADGVGGSLTHNAAQVLQDLGDAYKGPRNSNNRVDTTVLFRGSSAGDKVGPYVSQFLLASSYTCFPITDVIFPTSLTGINNLNIPALEVKPLVPIAHQREFGVSWDDFIGIQNGFIPKKYRTNDFDQTSRRYIINGRDLGTYVHVDTPYQFSYNVIDILTYAGFPLSKALPYQNNTITNEVPFDSMGIPDAYALIAGVCSESLKATWAQKWRAHRRLRPEAMAGLIHQAKATGLNTFNLHSSLFSLHVGIDTLALVLQKNQQQASSSVDPQQLLTVSQASTYLLSQMYPEGSPAHPSYPAGHAAIIGACVTVIKAIFEDTTPLKSHGFVPVKVNPTNQLQLVPLHNEGEDQMTVGSELDKLASNIALARNFAGVHYRSDGEEGIKLGEEVAIRYLQDHGCMYTEETFNGFELTKRNGTRIRIYPDRVEVVS